MLSIHDATGDAKHNDRQLLALDLFSHQPLKDDVSFDGTTPLLLEALDDGT